MVRPPVEAESPRHRTLATDEANGTYKPRQRPSKLSYTYLSENEFMGYSLITWIACGSIVGFLVIFHSALIIAINLTEANPEPAAVLAPTSTDAMPSLDETGPEVLGGPDPSLMAATSVSDSTSRWVEPDAGDVRAEDKAAEREPLSVLPVANSSMKNVA